MILLQLQGHVKRRMDLESEIKKIVRALKKISILKSNPNGLSHAEIAGLRAKPHVYPMPCGTFLDVPVGRHLGRPKMAHSPYQVILGELLLPG